jgi:nitroimidazol reductase NimA-like FMN-containing flavoprotein (pyridoxamine 5'-phosphate oxidase superfamily)
MQPMGEESCTSSFAYESVIGQGQIVEAEESEKEELLTQILAHYEIQAEKFNPIHLANTVVYKIAAENYTAKHRINDRI